MAARFAKLSKNELSSLLDGKICRKYEKSNENRLKCISSVLRSQIRKGRRCTCFERNFSQPVLRKFYAEARKGDGELYSKSSLLGICWRMIKQLLDSVLAKYRGLSVARRSIICLCLRHWQIIDLLATDKSRYFAPPRPVIDDHYIFLLNLYHTAGNDYTVKLNFNIEHSFILDKKYIYRSTFPLFYRKNIYALKE